MVPIRDSKTICLRISFECKHYLLMNNTNFFLANLQQQILHYIAMYTDFSMGLTKNYSYQNLKISNLVSKVIKGISGVLQGSHYGLFLFLLFLNNVSRTIKYCNFLLFADDFKLFKSIKSSFNVGLLQI